MLYRRSDQCASNCGWPNRPATSVRGCPTRQCGLYPPPATPVTACTPAIPRPFRRVSPTPLNFEVYHHRLQGRQRQDGSLGLQRPRNWKVADQSGFQPRASRQQHAGDAPGTQISLYLCAEQHRPCRRILDCARQVRRTRQRRGSPLPAISISSSVRTNMGATFGSDITPAGRARVHQEPGGSKLYFY